MCTILGSRAFASSMAAMTALKRVSWLVMGTVAQIFEMRRSNCGPSYRISRRDANPLLALGRVGLPHHARYAARLMMGRHHAVLQEAPRLWAEIAGPHIGPSAALSFAVASGLAGFPRRVRRYIEIAVVAAGAVN